MDATVEINTTCTLAAVRQITIVFEETLRHVVSDDSVAAVQLAVAEACANLVQHGSRGRTELPLSARMELSGNVVRITLIDRGMRFDLQRTSMLPEPLNKSGEILPNGRGVRLIRDLMDRVDYETRDGKNITTLLKTVSRVDLEESWSAKRRAEQAT